MDMMLPLRYLYSFDLTIFKAAGEHCPNCKAEYTPVERHSWVEWVEIRWLKKKLKEE
jgi:hypothetical protein